MSAFLFFFYLATDGAVSVNVSFQVIAKNHLIWFCKLFTNIRGLLFPAHLILRVKSTVIFTSKLFVWYIVYIFLVLSMTIVIVSCWPVKDCIEKFCIIAGSWSMFSALGWILDICHREWVGNTVPRVNIDLNTPGSREGIGYYDLCRSFHSTSSLLPVDIKKYIATVGLTMLKSILPW